MKKRKSSWKKRPISLGGKAIRAARLANGCSQLYLAESSGYAISSIGNWETGNHPPLFDAVYDIVTCLGFTVDEALELV